MDPIVIVIAIVVLMPLAVMWALAKSSQLRGPLSRRESHRRVDSLVTEVVPEPHPDSDDMDAPDSHSGERDPREQD